MPRIMVAFIFLLASSHLAKADDSFDVVIYGGTAGGAAAAVQVARQGKSVVLIEPGRHIGGLTSGGLGATDIGNKGAIGGVSREFYRRIRKHYDAPAAWKQEQAAAYQSGRQAKGEDTMWTFEPHVAEKILREMLAEAKVAVIFDERLDLKAGVRKDAGEIVSLKMESGRTFAGKCFIDASYEGDLLKLAGVSFHVGREANSVYDETLNGVQTRQATKHQLMKGIDPYVRPGDKSSGLLPGVHAGPPGAEGSGDKRVQAYNFRMCLTDSPDNRIPFTKPEGYDALRYELLLRNFEAGETRAPWNPILMPNRKTDVNNNHGFSTDNINQNYAWPEADYATRDKMFREHLAYQQGLMWTLVSNPRVPEKIRADVSRWGNCKDEFAELGGWPHQLYVREARRMVSAYVMTQHDCQGRRTAEDSVGLAAYTMDSHNTQRYVDEHGHARNEGDVQVGGFPPYPIAYRSIVPKESECTNLLAPVCLSASHIAYGSIRMEPVFMVLGQSAASAACLALDGKISVQQIDYAKLKERLLADGQVLAWTGPRIARAASLDPAKLVGIVVDDSAAKLTGEWSSSASLGGFVGDQYLHDGNAEKGAKSARFGAKIKLAGKYEVRLAYTPNPNRATNVPVAVTHADGVATIKVNQRETPKIDKAFVLLGTFRFEADSEGVAVVSNEGTDGFVIADAVLFVPAK